MDRLTKRSVAVAAGVLCAMAGGITVASAAGTPSPSASASPSAGTARHLHRPARLAGEVVSDRGTGGALEAGQLVVQEPDGTRLTLSLATRTRAWKYQGSGVKPISESPSSISDGEIVVVAARNWAGNQVAARILDLGFQAAS